ncbi:MAG: amidohydrolase [Candidatus Aramenus sp.]|nr:amidohydrolase [Candidatus Aramenus sp.]
MEVRNKTYTLVKCKFVLDSRGIKENVNVVVEDGVIKDVGNSREGDEVDCSNLVVTPGFVNSHTHTAMIAMRGYYDDSELQEWLQRMWDFEKRMPSRLMRLGSEIAVLEMLSSGTTAFVDMYFNPEDIKELAEKYKVRAFAGHTFLDSMLDPEEVARRQGRLRDSKHFKAIVNVHSIYAVGENTLKLAKELAESEGTWIHIHVSETRKEIYDVKRRTGRFPVEYLRDLGLTSLVNAVHLGWVASWEIEELKKARATTHCPTSNMKLATAGTFPFFEMMEGGINVTLGTDGASSNNSLDILAEMKTAVLLQRHNYWDTRIKAIHAFKAATVNGYKLLGIRGGLLENGYVADMVLFDASLLYPLTRDRLLSNIVYYAGQDALVATIADGVIYSRSELVQKRRKLGEELNRELEKL